MSTSNFTSTAFIHAAGQGGLISAGPDLDDLDTGEDDDGGAHDDELFNGSDEPDLCESALSLAPLDNLMSIVPGELALALGFVNFEIEICHDIATNDPRINVLQCVVWQGDDNTTTVALAAASSIEHLMRQLENSPVVDV